LPHHPRHHHRAQRSASFDAVVSRLECFVECKTPLAASQAIDHVSQTLLAVTQARSDGLSISEEQALALP
jgi:hypothetical protein